MTAFPPGADPRELDARRTDRYVEALLAAAERRAADVPADPDLDPDLRHAARRLQDELVRVHPSFRFEERLARRLAAAAASMRPAAAAGGEAAVVPAGSLDTAGALADGGRPGEVVPGQPGRPLLSRPVVVGGALTSAALSLAGAAYVAWRVSRGRPRGIA